MTSNLPSTAVRFIHKNGRTIPIFSRQKMAGAQAYRQAKRTVVNAARTATNEVKFAAGNFRINYANNVPRAVKVGSGVALGAAAAVGAGIGIRKLWKAFPSKTEGQRYQRNSTMAGLAIGTLAAANVVHTAANHAGFRAVMKRMTKGKQLATVGVAAAIPMAFWSGIGALDGAMGKWARDRKKKK
jgi:hypothetical protein